MGETTYKSEWLEPETWQKLLPGLALVAAGLAKLKQQLPKRGSSKRDLKKLSGDLDQLRENFERLLGLFSEHLSNNKKFLESFSGLLVTLDKAGLAQTLGNAAKVAKIALYHEERLKALESGAGKSKQGHKETLSRSSQAQIQAA
jgi:hypothetical protein